MSLSKNQEGRIAPNEIADLASRFSRVAVSIANIEASAPELLQQYAQAAVHEAPAVRPAPVAPVVETVPMAAAEVPQQVSIAPSNPLFEQSSAAVSSVVAPTMSAHEAMARQSVDNAYRDAA